MAGDPRSLWSLDEDITYLNHGSFGACPKAVLESQSRFRERLEREPVLFLARELEGLLDSSRRALGAFLGANPDGIVFVPNATTGVNTVLRSLRLGPGDEMLTTNHSYPSCKNTLRKVAAESGAALVEAAIPFPIRSPEQVVDGLLACVNTKTRICLIDHVTSPTGLVLPVSTLVRELQAKGIDVMVDGAHAPGMLPLNIEDTGAAYYTGNCHKWLCAPKGAAFLYVRPDRRDAVRPLVVSLGYESSRTDRSDFHLQFDWVGTGDPTPYLCIPEAIDYMDSLVPGGWPALMTHNRETVLQARSKLCALLGVPAPSPDEMIGSLASMPLPDGRSTAYNEIGDNDPIHRELFERHRIEVPVIAWPCAPRRLIRLSAQIYNKPGDYDVLADALRSLLPV